MATTVKLKNSVTTTAAPSSLVQGEVAVNITDKKVWVGNAASGVVQLVGPGSPDLAVADGGTGASDASTARTNLGAQATLVSGTNIKTINGSTLLGSGDLTVATSTTLLKNRIINGAMVISQRYGTTSTTPSATGYSLDRWNAFVGDGGSGIRYSFQQVTTAPTGFSNSILITTTTSGTSSAGDRYFIQQSVEGFNFADCGWGTADAKTVTISFWVRSSLTGTFGGALGNENQDRGYPFTYTISSANTWEYKSITVAGDTTGTWTGATNGTGVKLYLNIATGSTRTGTAGSWSANYYTNATGSVNLGQTASASINWTGVQLEVGSSATGFEYRQYTTEFALCQRYYTRYSNTGSLLSNQNFMVGVINSSVDLTQAGGPFPVVMRTAPTASYGGNPRVYDGSVAPNVTSIGSTSSSPTNAGVAVACSAGGFTVGRCGVVIPSGGGSTDYFAFSAEL